MRQMEAFDTTYGGVIPLPDRMKDSRTVPGIAQTLALWRPASPGLLDRAFSCARGFLSHRYTVLAMRILVAGVFLLSACGKLVDITRYSIVPVVEFGTLPAWAAPIFGAVLPFVELLCALGLLFGVLTRLSSLGVMAMSASFFFAKASLLMRGMDIACGCFGAVVTTLASLTIYMDPPIFLMALAVMISPLPARGWLSLGARLSGASKKK
jgi:putative oxidoreductase